MEGESGVTRSIIDELHCSDIQGDQMEVKVVLLEVSLMNFIPCRSNEIKKEGESGCTQSIIDEIHSWDIQRDQI